MKKAAWIVAAAAAMTAVLVSPAMAAGEWDYFHKTYAAAEKVAKAEGKPLYLHFTTTWCGWCRRIEKDIYSTEDGKKALSGFVCATLDCTEPKEGEPSADLKFNLELMKKYGGRGYPFLVMLSSDGALLHSFAGYKPLPAFKEELATAEKNFKKFKDFDAYAAKADKAGLEYNLKAMDLYSSTGAWAKAGQAAEIVKKLDPKAEKSDAAVVAFSILQAAEDRNDPAEKTLPLEEEVLKADPKNEKGYMEKVQFGRAQDLLRAAGRGASRDKAKLDQAVAALQTLLDKAAKISDKVNVYGFMGFIQFQADKFDDAVASMDKARELEAGGPRAATFEKYVEAIKKAKATAEAITASQPASKPAETKPAATAGSTSKIESPSASGKRFGVEATITDGDVLVPDSRTGGVIRIKPGMTKQAIEDAAKGGRIGILKRSDNEWVLGEGPTTVIIFVDGKFRRTKIE